MKTKKYNGKPMSHWQNEADELVAMLLLRMLNHCDERSIIGQLARPQVVSFINQVNPKAIQAMTEERDRCIAGFQAVMSDILDNPKKRPSMSRALTAVGIRKTK